MKHYSLKLIAALLAFVTPCIVVAKEPPGTIPWPVGTEALIDKAIAIKKDAQKKNMTMRTKGGVAGIEFAKCMDDLAVALADTRIEPKLLAAEGSDLKAKIALWALDRKRRPELYAKFAERHVNCPTTLEDTERFYGRKRGNDPYPRFLNPQPVTKEAMVEANRWVIEYLYFAPPTGREFEENPGRYVLGRALGGIRNEKSLVLLKFDLETQIDAFPDALPGKGSGGVIGDDVVQVLDFRTTEAFKITASLLRHAGVRKRIQNRLAYFSLPLYPQEYPLWKQKLDDYKQLANQEWQTDAEKELASWIKAIPPISPPEHLNLKRN